MLGLVEWQTNYLRHLTCILNNVHMLIILCHNFCCAHAEWISCYQDEQHSAESHTNEVSPASGAAEKGLVTLSTCVSRGLCIGVIE